MKQRIKLITCVAAIFWSGAAGASQDNVFLPTTGTYSALQAAGYINGALDALLTCSKGHDAPVNALGGSPKAGQCWLDDSNATLLVKKRYSGSGWVVEGVIDVSNGVWSPPVGGGMATVTAASTTDLCASPQAFQTISGAATIASFGSNCVQGTKKTLVFSASSTLTNNATSMILPGGLDFTAESGDVAEAVALGSGNWRITSITKINGTAVANPAVEVGSILYSTRADVPAKYVLGYGQALSRASYPDYLAAVTRTQTATRTSGSPTITVADTSGMGAGMPIEGVGLQNGTTVVSVTSSTIVMSQNAISSGSSTATVFLTGYGAGGSSSTVGVIDCRDRVIAGRGDMGGTAANRLSATYLGADSKALGATGGTESKTLLTANLPPYTPSGTVSSAVTGSVTVTGFATVYATGGGDAAHPAMNSNGNSTYSVSGTASGSLSGVAQGGTSAPFGTIQPTLITNCLVRVLAMNLPVNDNLPVGTSDHRYVIDRRFA